MVANTLLTPTVITREALRVLKNNLGFAKGINRQYDNKFANSGAKIGSDITIRKPVRYTVRTGAAASLQTVAEKSVVLSLDTQAGIDFSFSDADLTLTIDEFSKRYIVPAIAAICNKVDSDIAALYYAIYSSVGTPGTTMASIDDAVDANVKLLEAGCPADQRSCMVVNPTAQGGVVKGSKGLFQSSEQIKNQYEKGVMGIAAGFKWKMDQNVKMHTVGAYGGTPLVDGASQVGSSLVTDGWTSGASTLNKGDIFTIAGVYAINPQTRESTGSLQQFVVGADITSTLTAKTISISPEIIVSGAYQSVSGSPADNAAITVLGTASASYPQNMAIHEDSIVLGCADMELPKGVDMAARVSDPDSGLSIRLVRQYDAASDTRITRLDILYGLKVVYPELACRVWN